MATSPRDRSTAAPRGKIVPILNLLRKRIIDGEFAPGQRLPTLHTLRAGYRVSLATMQRVVQELQSDGYVLAHPGRGITVVERPPHLFRVGLVSSTSREDIERGHAPFISKLLQVATAYTATDGRTLTIYRHVTGHGDMPQTQRLLKDASRQQFAGLIFTEPTYLHTPLLSHLVRDNDFPSVVLGYVVHHKKQSLISYSEEAECGRVIEYLRQQGRRRAACIATAASNSSPVIDAFCKAASAAGIETRPSWMHCASPESASWTRNLARLLIAGHDRPDAIYLADDVLVPWVTQGLAESGVRCPQDLLVIGHANFPYPTESHVPAVRIGLELAEVLRLGVELVFRRRSGAASASHQHLRPVYDFERGANTVAGL